MVVVEGVRMRSGEAMRNVIFINETTGRVVRELPSIMAEEDLQVGDIIPVHLFIGGWKHYQIKIIKHETPTRVVVCASGFLDFRKYLRRMIRFLG